MLKNLIKYSGVTIVVIAIGMILMAKVSPSTDAQQDTAAQRRNELEQWEKEVKTWRSAQNEKATSFTSQGIMQLPNTGPSD